MAAKMARAAHRSGDATRLTAEQLPGRLDLQDSHSPLALQVFWLMRRYGLVVDRAALIAALCFDGGPSR